MQALSLFAHPSRPPASVEAMTARIIKFDADWLRLRWTVSGVCALQVPPFAGKGRADGLWQTTCFEFFLQPEGERGYLELNLSPSERWNAYRFRARREGMEELPMPREPVCAFRKGSQQAIFDAAIPVAALPPLPWRCAFTAVIEEEGACKSYWALGHEGDAPDFHDPACFTLALAAPPSP